VSPDFALVGAGPNVLQLGPGALVVVVGPSGAGKDTLIERARATLARDRRFCFPRRAITRTPDFSEDHDSLTPQDFADAERRGGFLLSWSAHGLSYGIPSVVAEHLKNGEIVVCNVSRTVIDFARQRCATVRVVLVTAPQEVRAVRLAGRKREPTIGERLGRTIDDFDASRVDFQLDNSTTVDAAVAQFVGYLQHVAHALPRT
jgi:ribose 1,5-bisphosphokinase